MGEEKPQEALGREGAVPQNPSLTPRSCLRALILLMNLYRQKTEAWKKSLVLGTQGEWKDSVKGLGTPGASRCVLGPILQQPGWQALLEELDSWFFEDLLYISPGDLVTK